MSLRLCEEAGHSRTIILRRARMHIYDLCYIYCFALLDIGAGAFAFWVSNRSDLFICVFCIFKRAFDSVFMAIYPRFQYPRIILASFSYV